MNKAKAVGRPLSGCFNASSWSQAKEYTGLAHGWMGHAWVWLHLAKAGLVPDDNRLRQVILNRIEKTIKTVPGPGSISHLIGTGAIPVVAAVACEQDPRFRGVLPRAVRWWAASFPDARANDVMLGAAGALLACAEIEACVPGTLQRDFVAPLQRRCEHVLEAEVETSRSKPVFLGYSHGLAGYVFAMETAQAAFGLRFKDPLRTRSLDRIMEERFQAPGKAAIWTTNSGNLNGAAMGQTSWCHGTPGVALAFLGCHRLTGKSAYKAAAKAGLEGTLLVPQRYPTFCCGATGVSQIFIEAWRQMGDRRWLNKARVMADSVDKIPPYNRRVNRGHHRGALGKVYLKWRLAHPQKLPLIAFGALSHS